MKWYLGCDPGWVNLAYAWLSEDGDLITGCVVPKELSKGVLAPMVVANAWFDHTNNDMMIPHELSAAAMERFVYYDGVHNPNSEQILMVTGQMQYFLAAEHSVTPIMFKAYDWKSRLSKKLFKEGFRNPSDRLDKVFSIAAAEWIYDREFETDHEADAACMAYIARIMDRD
ncbi:hypothetical protein VPHD148_0050 [Vibrio phage D148]